MKFRGLRPPTSTEDIPAFVRTELVAAINDIFLGLKKLTFGENFDSFEVDVEIPAGSIVSIVNLADYVPTRYIVVRNSKGQPIGDSDPESWNDNELKLRNYGTLATTIKVVFMR